MSHAERYEQERQRYMRERGIVEQPPALEPALATIRKQARDRVQRQLNAMWGVWGKMTREELGAMMDGAQEAVMEWLPPGPARR
jgi:hypothetical protein